MIVAKPPICKMCGINELIMLGSMNGIEIRFCALCDRDRPKRQPSK